MGARRMEHEQRKTGMGESGGDSWASRSPLPVHTAGRGILQPRPARGAVRGRAKQSKKSFKRARHSPRGLLHNITVVN